MSQYKSMREDSSSDSSLFEPFDLTVNLGPDSTPWLSAMSRVGSAHGIPRRAKSLPPLPELIDRVYDYTDAVQFADPSPDFDLSSILDELVFGDSTILQLFQATRGVAADRNRQLLFRILASPHLAVLPWELLPDPSAGRGGRGQRYLALAPDTHLVRMARGRTYPVRTTLLEAPLNLLIVLSSPTPQDETEDWLAFDIFEVKRRLLEELTPLEQAGLLHIDIEDRPTLENLRRRIGGQRRGYHLLHYVGHALPDKLILEDSAGLRTDVVSAQFVEVLRLCPDLRLAVFAGCTTARPASDPAALDPREAVGWRDLISLADFCVQEACPAVIGMQAVLPFSTERVFARFFYQALASGYSTAEALRLARGAIQGDEHVGGDLLDWSVPALFVGSNEPGPLLPRSAPVSKPVVRSRADLKLGLRQSNERFYGRDLALRQAVDIMSGQSPERVLMITGAAGVGKTCLVDRALEELPLVIPVGEVTRVLYTHFDRLAPDIVKASATLDADGTPDLEKLSQLVADDALKSLCRLTIELLRTSGVGAHDSNPAWSTGEWWERLVEDMVQHRFVLAIDEVGLLDRVQRGLLEKLIDRWLAGRVNADLHAGSPAQVLEKLHQLLSQLQEGVEPGQHATLPAQEPLASTLSNLHAYLKGLPDRLLIESSRLLGNSLERQVVMLGNTVPGLAAEKARKAKTTRGGKAKPEDGYQHNMIAALATLEAVRTSLGAALRVLADRRSLVRIVLITTDTLNGFLNLPTDQVFEMRLAQLSWPETWRWIRRNLPGLLSYGEAFLSQIWSHLGSNLDRWEELERRIVRMQMLGGKFDLQELAGEIAPAVPALTAAIHRSARYTRRGERPLRIAAAGPFLAGPKLMAEAIQRLAIEHGVGGRVVYDAEQAGALATLIDEPSPFAETGACTESQLMAWLQRIYNKQPDIVLLDYGGGGETPNQHALFRSVQYSSLLIAAGGNSMQDSKEITWPAAYPEVLSVGSLSNDGKLRPYTEWHPELGKPDLFATDDLSTSALAAAVKPQVMSQQGQFGMWGSSFAALHAVAIAALVWSLLPDLTPRALRSLLVEASTLIEETKPARWLKMANALALARERVVERTLRNGATSRETLSAITGLDAGRLSETLASLIEQKTVVRLTSGRIMRYQLINS